MLQAGDRAKLERLLADREQATGAQMVIAIFPSLEGESLEDFSIRLAQQWRIGRKGLDNGVILLVFLKEHKVRLEVGYGLEPVLTDADAAAIIRNVIAPRFRQDQYAAGLEAAVAAVFERVSGQGTRATARTGRGQGGQGWPVVGFFGLLAIIVVMLVIEVASPRRRARRSAYTGGSGGWDAPIVVVPPVWWGMRRGGRRDDDAGGGFSGGGGGFSGGGGSFGGGGASGEW